jgi:hypothetical protein
MGVQPLCFGDFHLGPQMKVTRPPGRDPARNAVRNTSMKRNNGPREQRAASGYRQQGVPSIAAGAQRTGALTCDRAF